MALEFPFCLERRASPGGDLSLFEGVSAAPNLDAKTTTDTRLLYHSKTRPELDPANMCHASAANELSCLTFCLPTPVCSNVLMGTRSVSGPYRVRRHPASALVLSERLASLGVLRARLTEVRRAADSRAHGRPEIRTRVRSTRELFSAHRWGYWSPGGRSLLSRPGGLVRPYAP